MSDSSVADLIVALEGDEAKRIIWLANLKKWTNNRNIKLDILKFAENWFMEFGLKNGKDKDSYYQNRSGEEQLSDWVYYQMEYTSGLIWDEKSNSVIINKDFITEKMRKLIINNL